MCSRDLAGLALRVTAIYQDENGVLEIVNSAATAPVGAMGMPATAGTPGDDIINGTPGPDVINGLGGNDTINGDDDATMIQKAVGNLPVRVAHELRKKLIEFSPGPILTKSVVNANGHYEEVTVSISETFFRTTD